MNTACNHEQCNISRTQTLSSTYQPAWNDAKIQAMSSLSENSLPNPKQLNEIQEILKSQQVTLERAKLDEGMSLFRHQENTRILLGLQTNRANEIPALQINTFPFQNSTPFHLPPFNPSPYFSLPQSSLTGFRPYTSLDATGHPTNVVAQSTSIDGFFIVLYGQ